MLGFAITFVMSRSIPRFSVSSVPTTDTSGPTLSESAFESFSLVSAHTATGAA